MGYIVNFKSNSDNPIFIKEKINKSKNKKKQKHLRKIKNKSKKINRNK